MKYTTLLLSLGLLLTGSLALAQLNPMYNSTEFNQAVKNNKYVVAVFVNENCGACKGIKHQLQEIAQSQLSKTVYFVEVFTDHCEQLCTQYQVKGTPSFVFFKDGKHVNAKNDGEETSIVLGYHSPSSFTKELRKIIHETFDISTAQ